jgi:succinyl-CoA synthetase beta subunit
MHAATLGDPSGFPHDDDSYTGDVSDSVFSMDYVRERGRQLQELMNNLDGAYMATLDALDTGALDEATAADLGNYLADFESRRATLRGTAEAFNAGAALVNAAGGRMPSLSIPATLGIVPLVIPAAMIAAVATAGALITWGVVWLQGLNARLANAQLLEAQDTPEARAALARSQATAANALDAVNGSPWTALSSLAKWGGIAALAWIAFRAFGRSGGRR